eukprot:snap_masked-scaffold_11-processed-gene-4.23-mRNA-1 protein AED:1.00 eAED:1.00 QI:0/-1/0/0/-1/1/1/0/251
MDLLNGDKLILEYQGGNQYLLAGTPVTIFLEPPCAKLIVSSVFDIPYPNNGSKDYIFNLVLMDPPWPVGSSSHTRGVKLDYPLLSLSQISKIKLPIRHFPYGTLLFIWVTTTSYLTTLRWTYKLNFCLVDDIAWIKVTSGNKLHRSIGYVFQHSQETCLVFIRKEHSHLKYQDVFNEDFSDEFSNTILTKPTSPSVKPEEFYLLLNKSFPTRRKIEFFGRTNNIRVDWTTTGLELDDRNHVVYSQSTREIS